MGHRTVIRSSYKRRIGPYSHPWKLRPALTPLRRSSFSSTDQGAGKRRTIIEITSSAERAAVSARTINESVCWSDVGSNVPQTRQRIAPRRTVAVHSLQVPLAKNNPAYETRPNRGSRNSTRHNVRCGGKRREMSKYSRSRSLEVTTRHKLGIQRYKGKASRQIEPSGELVPRLLPATHPLTVARLRLCPN